VGTHLGYLYEVPRDKIGVLVAVKGEIVSRCDGDKGLVLFRSDKAHPELEKVASYSHHYRSPSVSYTDRVTKWKMSNDPVIRARKAKAATTAKDTSKSSRRKNTWHR